MAGRWRPVSVVAAFALLLLQAIGTGLIACLVFVRVFLTPPPPAARGLEIGSFAIGLAAAAVIYWAAIYVPFALVLARGVWLLRPWARAGIAFFEAVQAVLMVGLFGTQVTQVTLASVAWWGVTVGIPIAILALLFGHTSGRAFAAAPPTGWRF